MLEIKNLTKYFGNHLILKDFNLHIKKGEVVQISGPSGVGKTTLLRCIAGLEKFETGSIILNKILVQSGKTFVPSNKRKIGMAFQDLALWPHMTIWQNVDFVSSSVIKTKAERKSWNKGLLTHFKIDHKKDKYSGELSGGEQQRAALARAFANKPKLLLLDEPFSNLDQPLAKDIFREIEDMITREETTVIIISHEPWAFEKLSCQNIKYEDSFLR